MSTTVDQQATVPSRTNPNLEVHNYCFVCRPAADRALCGSRLHGIDMPNVAMTCAICADLGRCPECGRP